MPIFYEKKDFSLSAGINHQDPDLDKGLYASFPKGRYAISAKF